MERVGVTRDFFLFIDDDDDLVVAVDARRRGEDTLFCNNVERDVVVEEVAVVGVFVLLP